MISHDLVGPRMAGPGMRYWELAQVLARHCPVTLAAPEGSRSLDPSSAVRVAPYPRQDAGRMRQLVEQAEVVVAPGDTLVEFPFLLSVDKYKVMDGYDPHTFESLAWNEGQALAGRLNSHRGRLEIVNAQCAVGDFFLCASERQRMLWLGWLEATGRVNPMTFDQDRALRALVDVVPTGIPSEPPQRTRPLVRDTIPGIGADDPLLVWGGGVWNWLDPLTLLRALALVVQTQPRVRLFFPGPRHPYQEFVPDMAMRERAVALSQELGLAGRNVFWGDWVPYHERQNYLLEANIGCSLHYESIESTFSFRTRVLDYIWAGLPMILTRGDAASEWVERYGLGAVVDYQDTEGVAKAIVDLAAAPREAFQERFERARLERSWEHSAQPLVRFCLNPLHAPDLELEPQVAATWWKGLAAGFRSGLGQADGGLWAAQGREMARLQDTIVGYEQGRFMRLMRWLHGARRKVTRGR
jgi:glycosyltransferase involved in cell wall biosynthesis